MRKNSLFAAAVSLLLGFAGMARAQVAITEFMAADNQVFPNEHGVYQDWIEIQNVSGTNVNLLNWHLTDNAGSPTKFTFPATNLPPGGFLIVFASGTNQSIAGRALHAAFSLNAGGEYLGLLRPNLSVASQFSPEYAAQIDNFSYGPFQGTNYFYDQPSPGASNSLGFVAQVADTEFSHDRGFYQTNFSLVINCDTPLATIRYTTNGSFPSATNGMVYSAPIPINRTTVIRAAAFRPGFIPSNIDTHSYLYIADVIFQSTNGLAPPGWPSSWGTNVVDYGMDPNIVAAPPYNAAISNALLSLPSLCIVTDLNYLFDPTNGIYANAGQDGIEWERSASLELLRADNQNGFQADTGLRIRGGFSREGENPKHSFRCIFRSAYGDAKLRYELFGPDGDDTIDKLDIRTAQDNSWAFQGDDDGMFLPDMFSRDTQLAMGRAGTRGDFYHLYINGQYWGLYNTEERPEEQYAASYFGGDPEDYDVVRIEAGPFDVVASAGNLDAWFTLWRAATNGFANDADYQKVQGNNPDGTPNASYEVLLDVPNLIDYMLIVIYTANFDGPVFFDDKPNNFYALRNRTTRDGFRFITHDAELSLLDLNFDRTVPTTIGDPDYGGGFQDSNPAYVWKRLSLNAEFRMLVADHVHRFFFNGGLLTTQACAARWINRTNEIHRAMVAESARWGDAQVEPPITQANWLNVMWFMRTIYFPQRSAIVLNQLRNRGLYPLTVAPAFNQFGGIVSNGFNVTMTAPAGTIYYTLDGTDPRLPGGGISSSALVYSGAVALAESVQVKARVKQGSSWSALNEAPFYVPQNLSGLLITEIMYHPPGTTNTDDTEFEFIELKNVSGTQLDLSGARFTNGITFVFPVGTKLPAGEFVVLVSNPEVFASQYPAVPIAGAYQGHLSNSGEALALVDVTGTNVVTLSYADGSPWPPAPDGIGFSLVPVNPNLNPDPNNALNWRASSAVGGSPNADDPASGIAPMLINEALTHTDLPLVDAIEIYNPNATNVDIGHWFLTDQRTVPKKFRIPSPALVPAGGYLVLTENQWNADPGSSNSFRLDSHGEEIYLYSADAGTNLTGFSDGFAFGAAQNGVAFGRYVNSVGDVQYPAQLANTLSNANTGPRVGPVVINEIRYHPSLGGDEFIELKNLTNTAVKLYDPANPENTWRLDGVGFSFPTNTELAANGLALLTPLAPSAFRAKYNVPVNVPIFGPYPGTLQDSGENLELQRPDVPDFDTNTATYIVPYIAVDVIRYNDRSPWPTNADGAGPSLERIDARVYGNDPVNWRDSTGGGSPGQENNGIADWKILHFTPAELANATISGDLADPDGDGHNNLSEYIAGTDPRDAESVLRLETAPLSGGPWIGFLAEPGKSYTVHYRTSLLNGVWLNLTNIPPFPSTQFIQIPSGLSDPARYYRLVTPQD